MSDVVARLNKALEGRYTLESELGEGGMATVYLTRDLKHNRGPRVVLVNNFFEELRRMVPE